MTDGVLLYHDCPNCKRYQLSASMWRNEAYKHAGTPLPWEPEELLREEYKRGYADAMGWKVQNHLEHLPPQPWTDLTDEEVVYLKMLGRDLEFVSMTALRRFARDIAQTIKEKNT